MNGQLGKLVILSGPSGAGKSTLVQQLLADCPVPLKLSVSATTRAPRQGEVDGRHYHFLSPEEFARRREKGAFLECKEVFGRGDWYGTLRSEVATGHSEGKWVLLEIDVAGALAVLQQVPDAVTIFVHPGSLEELEHRLRVRGTEDAKSVARRLEVARKEMAAAENYQYEVINDTVERAVKEICEILNELENDGMLEELKEEEIVNKVGGRFKLSTLIQKRLVQLNAGSRALVDMDTGDKMSIVLREIMQDKIFLDTSNEVKITGELPESEGGPEFNPMDI